MATKKLIAICQSGGKFETNKDGFLSYNGGEAYAVDIDHKTKLGDFKKEVAENFECSVHGVVIKYFLPGNKKTLITVSKDKDFKRMVSFYGDADQVEVFVMMDGAVAQNVSNMPASRSSRTTESEAVVLSAAPADMILADDPIDMDMPIETLQGSGTRKSGSNRTTMSAAVILSATPTNMFRAGDPIDMDMPIETIPNGDDHHNAASQWQNTITGVGQTFSTFAEFREALRKYSIAHGFNYKYKKNETHRVTVICKLEACPWRIHVSRLATTELVCIKTMNPTHTCEVAVVKPAYRATRTWVGNIIREKLKVSPSYKPKEIVNDFKRVYGIELNYSQAWRAKEMAREMLQGSYRESYNQLPFFCKNIMETNPGSLATFTTKEDSSFHRLFVSFHASIIGFQQGCRPLIFLDSTPLNSKYQGVLLAATAADGDDDVFPVGFAVVDEETDDNWHWFASELKSIVSTSRQITFVADFQKGLKESLREIYSGECYHGYCLWYLADKLNKDLKGQLSHEARHLIVQDLYAAAYAPKVEGFERCTGNIKAISPEAYNWVIRSEPDHWANAFFRGARYNHMTSNFGQLFYSWVSDATELPITITQTVDVLRGKMMEMIYTRRVNSNQWMTTLTPSMEEKLKNETLKAGPLQVIPLDGSTFEVRGESVEMVDIDHWDCSCKGWQLVGLPCCHAIAVFEILGRSVYDYCSRYLTVESYRLTYAESIHPIPNVESLSNGELTEAEITVTPPPAKRLAGRPKMKQAGSVEIIKRQLQCSRCKVLGHNKRSCKCSSPQGAR